MVSALGSRVGWTPARKEQTNKLMTIFQHLNTTLQILPVFV